MKYGFSDNPPTLMQPNDSNAHDESVSPVPELPGATEPGNGGQAECSSGGGNTGAGTDLAVDPVAEQSYSAERKFFRLRHCRELLEWADSLCRTGDAASLVQARELYEAVLFAHGIDPEIARHWPEEFRPSYTNHTKNTEEVLQAVRAQKALSKIESKPETFAPTGTPMSQGRFESKDPADSKIEIADSRTLLSVGDDQASESAAVGKADQSRWPPLADSDSFGGEFMAYCGPFLSIVPALPGGEPTNIEPESLSGFGL